MTRPEDTWSPDRHERAVTIRFGKVTAITAGVATVEIVGGSSLTSVPCYGATAAIGTSVLVLHDGQKVVAIA
jgi:hypothetical protein